jgi:hypothetical protein
MRQSIKRSLTGLFVVGALASSAVGAGAMGGSNGPDAFIGIINGGPHPYGNSADGGYDYKGGGYQANTYQNYWSGHAPRGANKRDHQHGY